MVWRSGTISAESEPGLGRQVRGRRLRRRRRRRQSVQAYEARIAALERLVGKQALELEFPKGASASSARAKNAPTSVITGPAGSPSFKDAG